MPFRVRVRRLLEGVPGGHAVLSVGPLLLGVRYTTLRGTTVAAQKTEYSVKVPPPSLRAAVAQLEQMILEHQHDGVELSWRLTEPTLWRESAAKLAAHLRRAVRWLDDAGRLDCGIAIKTRSFSLGERTLRGSRSTSYGMYAVYLEFEDTARAASNQ